MYEYQLSIFDSPSLTRTFVSHCIKTSHKAKKGLNEILKKYDNDRLNNFENIQGVPKKRNLHACINNYVFAIMYLLFTLVG